MLFFNLTNLNLLFIMISNNLETSFRILMPAIFCTYPPKHHRLESESPNSYVCGIWRWGNQEVIRIRRGMRVVILLPHHVIPSTMSGSSMRPSLVLSRF
jgi:hypothetical protein